MAKKTTPKFPAEIYVGREGTEQYLVASESISEIGEDCDGEPIAVYKLTEVKTFRVTKGLG